MTTSDGRVMGAWFALFHDEEAMHEAVLADVGLPSRPVLRLCSSRRWTAAA